MNKNFLTTTLLSLALFSLNLSASNCSTGFCMIDLASINNQKIEKEKIEENKEFNKITINDDSENYSIRMIDNIETIVFADDDYRMTEDELLEYELTQLAKTVEENMNSSLPQSEYYCEENLKVVILEESEHLYTCA